jgi:curved DNA-binding protein
VPTLTQKLQLQVPAHSQTGQRLRLKGKGLPMRDGQGDLFVVLKVVMPPAEAGELQAQWQAMADRVPFDPRARWGNTR